MHSARACSALVAALLLASCSPHKPAVVTTSGTVAVTSSDGDVAAGEHAADASKLGAPVYPGAATADSGGVAMHSDKGAGEMIAFKTSDSFAKVYDFYKHRMPPGSETMKYSQGDSSLATFQIGRDGDAETTSVMITAKSGETDILITHGTKKAGG